MDKVNLTESGSSGPTVYWGRSFNKYDDQKFLSWVELLSLSSFSNTKSSDPDPWSVRVEAVGRSLTCNKNERMDHFKFAWKWSN